MAVGDNGQGLWDTSAHSGNGNPAPANPNINKNMLSQVGSNSVTDAGKAQSSSNPGSNGLSPDQGSGPPNKPSPNASLLNTTGGTLSPDQGAGAANKPSPPMNLLNTVGRKSAAPEGVRQPAWGGTASAIGRNDVDPNKPFPTI